MAVPADVQSTKEANFEMGAFVPCVFAPANGHAPQLADPTSRAGVLLFRQVAKTCTDRITLSKEKALETLVAEGIYTKSGRLSKNYR